MSEEGGAEAPSCSASDRASGARELCGTRARAAGCRSSAGTVGSQGSHGIDEGRARASPTRSGEAAGLVAVRRVSTRSRPARGPARGRLAGCGSPRRRLRAPACTDAVLGLLVFSGREVCEGVLRTYPMRSPRCDSVCAAACPSKVNLHVGRAMAIGAVPFAHGMGRVRHSRVTPSEGLSLARDKVRPRHGDSTRKVSAFSSTSELVTAQM